MSQNYQNVVKNFKSNAKFFKITQTGRVSNKRTWWEKILKIGNRHPPPPPFIWSGRVKPHLRSSSQRDKPRYRVGEVGCEGDNQTTKRTWNYQTYEKQDWLVSLGPILVQIDKYKSLQHCFGQLVAQFWQNLQKKRLVLLSVSFYCVIFSFFLNDFYQFLPW